MVCAGGIITFVWGGRWAAMGGRQRLHAGTVWLSAGRLSATRLVMWRWDPLIESIESDTEDRSFGAKKGSLRSALYVATHLGHRSWPRGYVAIVRGHALGSSLVASWGGQGAGGGAQLEQGGFSDAHVLRTYSEYYWPGGERLLRETRN